MLNRNKKYIHFSTLAFTDSDYIYDAADAMSRLLRNEDMKTLNVAGSRASKADGIYIATLDFLSTTIRNSLL